MGRDIVENSGVVAPRVDAVDDCVDRPAKESGIGGLRYDVVGVSSSRPAKEITPGCVPRGPSRYAGPCLIMDGGSASNWRRDRYMQHGNGLFALFGGSIAGPSASPTSESSRAYAASRAASRWSSSRKVLVRTSKVGMIE